MELESSVSTKKNVYFSHIIIFLLNQLVSSRLVNFLSLFNFVFITYFYKCNVNSMWTVQNKDHHGISMELNCTWSINTQTKNLANIQQPSWPPIQKANLMRTLIAWYVLFYTQLYKMSILDSTYQYSNIVCTFPPPITFTATYTH